MLQVVESGLEQNKCFDIKRLFLFNNIIDLLYKRKPEYTAYSDIALKSLLELYEHSKNLSSRKPHPADTLLNQSYLFL